MTDRIRLADIALDAQAWHTAAMAALDNTSPRQITPPSAAYRVTTTTDVTGGKLTCDPCGELRPGGDLEAHGRRHAAQHPDHEVRLTSEVTKHFFARPKRAAR